MNRCMRCQCPCDAFAHTSKVFEEGKYVFTAYFCTFFCANHYHRVSGAEVIEPNGKVSMPAEQPMYVLEAQHRPEWLVKLYERAKLNGHEPTSGAVT